MQFLCCCFDRIHRTGSGRKVGTVTPAWSLSVSSLCCRLHLLRPPHPACKSQSLARTTIWRVEMGTMEKRMPPAPTWSTRHGRSSAQLPSSPGALALLPHATTSPSKSPPASSLAWSTGMSLSPSLTTYLHFHFFLPGIPSPVALSLAGMVWILSNSFEISFKKISSGCLRVWHDVWLELLWFRWYICHCPSLKGCCCSS